MEPYLFINTETGEYPRHIGDVEQNPDAPWAPVNDVPYPGAADEGFMWADGEPELRDGEYFRTWVQVPLPKPTRESVLLRLGITEEELALLFAR